MKTGTIVDFNFGVLLPEATINIYLKNVKKMLKKTVVKEFFVKKKSKD